MINKVILVGHLGKDPEIRHLESGGVVSRFSLATSDSYKDKSGQWQKQTEWHDITAWGALAERVGQQLKKGNLIYVEGKITHRKWQDREGKDRYSTDIVANVIRSMEKRERSGTAIEESASSADDMHPGVPDDDLPF